jgi:hypothetical protein
MKQFREIWLVDFEFRQPPGEPIDQVHCMIAWDLKSNQKHYLWADELKALKEPPFSLGKENLYVAYYASAEMQAHIHLGWPAPYNLLDLFTEFRNLTNNLSPPCGDGILGALYWFGFDGIGTEEKKRLRDLCIRGAPFTLEERKDVLAYCATDVEALAKLLPEMWPGIDLPRALFRGQYMVALAQIEHDGIPIDTQMISRLQANWESLQHRILAKVNERYRLWDGLTFKIDRFAKWLGRERIPWPRTEKGQLRLDADTFSDQVKSFPQLRMIHEARAFMGKTRLQDLQIGRDGRSRCMLSAFRTVTGRNAPSSSAYPFGNACWYRGLIKPKENQSICYLDYSQQEWAIAAYLSGDLKLIEAYETTDPYMTFAIQAGAAPKDATKETHPEIRDQFKACALAVLYGMGPYSLSKKINQPLIVAQELLRLHKGIYRRFWEWSEANLNLCMFHGHIETVLGWTYHRGPNPNPRSVINFPMQANASDMLRILCVYGVRQGIEIVGPVHDAILITANTTEMGETIKKARQLMGDASAIILGGPQLRTDVYRVDYPFRYMDKRGVEMWELVQKNLVDIESERRTRVARQLHGVSIVRPITERIMSWQTCPSVGQVRVPAWDMGV